MAISAEFILGAMLTVIGSLVATVIWLARAYLTGAFARNDMEHAELNDSLSGVSNRVDHIIRHHENMPPYADKRGKH